MTTLFISDLHLSAQSPDNVRAFFAFVADTAAGADALYILGDLFEYWAGDDDDTPLATGVASALARRAANGTPIFFVPGNRDFLLGDAFAEAAGMRILADPTMVQLDGQRLLLSHGDALCTDDIAYQQYRRQVRAEAWQAAFLARPWAERRQLIEDLRRRSEGAKREKALDIMDVNPAAVEETLRAYGYPWLVHGHTHRPARHSHRVDGHVCERWVLSDWRGTPTYLCWEGGRLRACPPDC